MVCELCGSNDFTKDDDGFFVCDYCRTKYTPEQAQKMLVEGTVRVDRSDDADKYLKLAQAALDHANISEASSYANRVLEIDTENSRAWFIKGEAALQSSELGQTNHSEMTGAFEKAISFASDQNQVRQQAAEAIVRVVQSVQNRSRAELARDPSSDVCWESHVKRTEDSIKVLFEAHEWGAGRRALELAIGLAMRLNKAPEYTGSDGKVTQRRLDVRRMQYFKKSIDTAAEMIRKDDPDYRPPKQSPCFIVTATLGSETSTPVRVLRRFRDELLVETGPGRRFIAWYGENGPRLASAVSAHWSLRVVSFVVVVLPAWALAQVLLDARSIIRGRR